MMVLDAHQHYWDVQRFDYGWDRQGLDRLNRPYLPLELEPQLAAAGVRRTVAVQVLHDPAETAWLLNLARDHDSIAGVVGWVDLQADPDDIAAAIELLRADAKFVGIRHLVHEEPDVDWLIKPGVLAGLAVLEKAGVPFDLLLRPQHLAHVPVLSDRLPELRMVIDHLAKPRIRSGVFQPWASELGASAANPNVFCKVSGLVTEADHEGWRASDLTPYIAHAIDVFGPSRVMYGSDWPVCTLAGDYGSVIAALRSVLGGADDGLEAAMFSRNAQTFYGISRQSGDSRR